MLILVPVVMLVGMGLFALRQDRLSAQNEARESAQALADALLRRIWSGLTNKVNGWLGPAQFEIGSQGELLSPVPWPNTPVPAPLNYSELDERQLQLWSNVEGRSHTSAPDNASAKSLREFLDSNPPDQFAAVGEHMLALMQAESGNAEEAIQTLGLVASRYPSAMSEAGLPLAHLAKIKALEIAHTANRTVPLEEPFRFENVCADLVNSPTLLTPYLLGRLSGFAATLPDKDQLQKWQHQWEQDEFSRRLYVEASPRFRTASYDLLSLRSGKSDDSQSPFWVSLLLSGSTAAETQDEQWLIFCGQASSGSQMYQGQSEAKIGRKLSSLLRESFQVPEYFGVGLEIGGIQVVRDAPDLRLWKEVNYMSRGGGGLKKEALNHQSTNLLAAATLDHANSHVLKVSVYLTGPDRLFRAQRARRFWFGSLIAASAVAALIGLAAAYRAFLRQHRLNELKSNFVSSVSHELRAPIASVRLMAESLQNGKVTEPGKQHEYFAFISRECRRLSSLIENVLDFSRIEQGRKNYEFEPTNLHALAESTVKLMEPYAVERRVTLQLEATSTNPLEAVVDGKALQQALINLIDNALKHSPPETTITIGLQAVPLPVNNGVPAPSAPHAGIKFWVEDQGEGIPVEEHEKIFERFYRCGSELRRQTQGAGIGLSIVKHIIETHGGTIHVRSAVGQGSRFTIDLPNSDGEPS